METTEGDQIAARLLFDSPVAESVLRPVLVDGRDPISSRRFVAVRSRMPVDHHLRVTHDLVEDRDISVAETP